MKADSWLLATLEENSLERGVGGEDNAPIDVRIKERIELGCRESREQGRFSRIQLIPIQPLAFSPSGSPAVCWRWHTSTGTIFSRCVCVCWKLVSPVSDL